MTHAEFTIAIGGEYTIEHYKSIRDAIALGARQVQYGDKMITYASLNDMLKIKQMIYDSLVPPPKGGGLFGRATVGCYNSGK